MVEKPLPEEIVERERLVNKLARSFLCSVRERFELLREMGLEDNVLVNIDAEGSPKIVASGVLMYLSSDKTIETQFKQAIGDLQTGKEQSPS